MGLDISIIKTPRCIDLAKIYAVREAVVEGFPWYLGNDKNQRAVRWTELKDKCKSLTKDEVLANTTESEELANTIKQMSDGEFNDCLSWIVSSISPHQDGNTHLDFDYDMLPGRTLLDSCSWNLRALFLECKKNRVMPNQCGDFISELDGYKIWSMAERWRRMSFKLNLARWIGYFSERIGYNILRDCLQELGVDDVFVEFQDVKHYQKGILKVADDVLDSNNRYWIVSSY